MIRRVRVSRGHSIADPPQTKTLASHEKFNDMCAV